MSSSVERSSRGPVRDQQENNPNISNKSNPSEQLDPGGKVKSSKTKTHISMKEYEELTELMKLHLKQQEQEQEENFTGVRWGDLSDWVIRQVLCIASLYHVG